MDFLKLRRWRILAALVLLFFCGAAFLYGISSKAPRAPGNLDSFNASAERGQYLATAGNCSSCHTVEGETPYAGGRAFQTPFGVLYSTNITPDPDTGIGNWSFQDFYNSIKYGVRPDGAHLYPAFPYTSFSGMTDEDIASLYLYMQTIDPVTASARPDELRFPYNQRALLGFWKLLFHDSDSYQPDPKQSEAWNRGAYLVEAVGHCGACHTPRNSLGAERRSLALTGGVYMDRVNSGGPASGRRPI